jgi:hypothetical protein
MSLGAMSGHAVAKRQSPDNGARLEHEIRFAAKLYKRRWALMRRKSIVIHAHTGVEHGRNPVVAWSQDESKIFRMA